MPCVVLLCWITTICEINDRSDDKYCWLLKNVELVLNEFVRVCELELNEFFISGREFRHLSSERRELELDESSFGKECSLRSVLVGKLQVHWVQWNLIWKISSLQCISSVGFLFEKITSSVRGSFGLTPL